MFSDGTRSMALVVDEIVDIVEDRLDIEVAGGSAGVLGSAIVKGQATEIIDVGHFLPLAFEDWFRRKEQKVAARRRAVLLVDDSPFFRNMLAPVLQAAGFDVTSVGSGAEALAHVDGGRAVDIVITDIEMPEMDGFALTRRCGGIRAAPSCRSSGCPRSSRPRRSRAAGSVGFHDYVAKFDRQGLIAALKEQSEFGRAA